MARWRQQKRQANGNLTAFQMSVALAVYVLSGRNTQAAVSYAQSLFARNQNLPTEGTEVERLGTCVENALLHRAPSELAALELPSKDQARRVRREAVKHLAEARTPQWVQSQNADFGAAPSMEATAAQYIGGAADVGATLATTALRASLRNAPVCHDADRYLRWRGKGFRTRWRISFGCLAPRPDLPPEELAMKARVSAKCSLPKRALAPKPGAPN